MPVKDFRHFSLVSDFALLLLLGGILVILPLKAVAYPINKSSPDGFTLAPQVSQQNTNPQVYLPSIRYDEHKYTWSLLGPDGFDVTMMASQSSLLFAGTNGSGTLRSIDDGQTWIPMSGGLPEHGDVRAFATADYVPTLYASFHDQHKIYRSEDNGDTWIPATPPSALWANVLVLDPITPTTIYAGVILWELTGGWVFRSRDGGESWQQILPKYTHASDIAIDPQNTNIIYVGRGGGGGMLKSYDGGNSWDQINTGLSGNALSITEILIIPNDPRSVYIATADGLFHSLNSGKSWSEIGQVLPGQYIRSIGLMPNGLGELVVSTSTGGSCYGISKSIDGELAWQDISGNLGSNTCVDQLVSTNTFFYVVAEIEYSIGQIWQLQNP